MKKGFTGLLIFLVMIAFACSSSDNMSHMKFSVIDENGNTQDIQIFGIPTDASQDEMNAIANDHDSFTNYNRTDDHPWGGEYRALPKPKRKFVKCGEFAQANPIGDCCCKKNSSCICEVIVNQEDPPTLPPMAKTQE